MTFFSLLLIPVVFLLSSPLGNAQEDTIQCPSKLAINGYTESTLRSQPTFCVANDCFQPGEEAPKWKDYIEEQFEKRGPTFVVLADSVSIEAELETQNINGTSVSCQYKILAQLQPVYYLLNTKTKLLDYIYSGKSRIQVEGFGSLQGEHRSTKFYFQLRKFGEIPEHLSWFDDDFYAVTTYHRDVSGFDLTLPEPQSLRGFVWHQMDKNQELLRIHSSQIKFNLIPTP